MHTVATIAELRNRMFPVYREGVSIGLVPTMGALHHGHMELVRRARIENDCVVVSIFVNPLQFAPSEDLSLYPRDLERDRAMLQAIGADFLFAPTVAEMYPRRLETVVELPRLGTMLEGAVRPGHFTGVATVVTKLFNIVRPLRAYFGEKDFQQLHIIRRMASDLDTGVRIVGVPTVREPDGLAASSRNVYLSEGERRAAPVLYRALTAAQDLVRRGETSARAIEAAVREVLGSESLARPEIVAVCDAETLEPVKGNLPDRVLVILAVHVGTTRLIDECVIARAGEAGS